MIFNQQLVPFYRIKPSRKKLPIKIIATRGIVPKLSLHVKVRPGHNVTTIHKYNRVKTKHAKASTRGNKDALAEAKKKLSSLYPVWLQQKTVTSDQSIASNCVSQLQIPALL